MTAPLLDIRHLRLDAQSAQGQPVRIVEDISLALSPGEVIGLIGESGAGKSTIGLAALAYTRPGCRITSGDVVFDGVDLLNLSRNSRRRLRGKRVAYIAQSAAAAFNPAKTLNDQICEVPVRHGVMSRKEAEQHAIELYKALDLPSPETIGRRYPHEVSGGQLQRAMAAMAMVCHPDLLVFDEPTTGLDVTTQIEVLLAFRGLIRSYHTAALYITHDLAVVAQMADRIMVLRGGQMVEEGEVRAVLEDPQERYTKDLIRTRASMLKCSRSVATDTSPLVTVTGVTAAYGRGPAVLRNVGLTVERGETVAVVGESGSGKSTLARVITGLMPPRHGGVRLAGRELPRALGKRQREDLRRIQMIYQMPDVALNPRHTVEEIVGRPLAFYFQMAEGDRRKRVAELLQQIGLDLDYMTRYPGELSGGQKQRVCIARALAAKPDLIICDEVTSALDQLVAESILTLLADLQNEVGLAYLLITHDLGIVRRIADRVIVMRQGEIVEQGRTAGIFAEPQESYTKQLLRSVPEMRVNWLDDVADRRLCIEQQRTAKLAKIGAI